MKNYTRREKTNYDYPYKLMLHDIREEVDYFQAIHKAAPNYIIINPNDGNKLRFEMAKLKLLPHNHSGKVQYMGIGIIQTQEMPEGCFDVVGN